MAENERESTRRRVYTALHGAVATLTKEEQILVRMRTEFKVSDIARLRRVEQKPLYRRLEKAYKKLRKELAHQGVRKQDIEEVLGDICPDLLDF